jgi:hypothetical protein
MILMAIPLYISGIYMRSDKEHLSVVKERKMDICALL